MFNLNQIDQEFDIEAWQKEQNAAITTTSDKLHGKKFVVTGKLKKYLRSQINSAIQNHGGVAGDKVDRATDYVIVGVVRNGIAENGSRSSKLIAAERLGIPIITEREFERMIES